MGFISFMEENFKYIILAILLSLIYHVLSNKTIEPFTETDNSRTAAPVIKWYKDTDSDGIIDDEKDNRDGVRDYFGHGYTVIGGVATPCGEGKYAIDTNVCVACLDPTGTIEEIIGNRKDLVEGITDIYNTAFNSVNGIVILSANNELVIGSSCVPARIDTIGGIDTPYWDEATKYKVLTATNNYSIPQTTVPVLTDSNVVDRYNTHTINQIRKFLEYNSERGTIDFKEDVNVKYGTLSTIGKTRDVVAADKKLMDIITPVNTDINSNIKKEIYDNFISIRTLIANSNIQNASDDGRLETWVGDASGYILTDEDILFVEHLYRVISKINAYINGLVDISGNPLGGAPADNLNQLDRFLKLTNNDIISLSNVVYNSWKTDTTADPAAATTSPFGLLGGRLLTYSDPYPTPEGGPIPFYRSLGGALQEVPKDLPNIYLEPQTGVFTALLKINSLNLVSGQEGWWINFIKLILPENNNGPDYFTLSCKYQVGCEIHDETETCVISEDISYYQCATPKVWQLSGTVPTETAPQSSTQAGPSPPGGGSV
jgi:hypothetical protein